MKNLIKLITFILLATSIAWGGELTGSSRREIVRLLERHGINVRDLKRSGRALVSGELTGAGNRIQLRKIDTYITTNKVIHRNNVRNLVLRRHRRVPVFNDIASFRYRNRNYRWERIYKNSIQALIVRRR